MKWSSFAAGMLALATLVGCSDAPPSGDPAKSLREDTLGYRAPIGVMMGLNEKPYWVQSALAGFRVVADDDVPASIGPIGQVNACAFTPPRPDEVLAKVQLYDSDMDGPVYAFSRKWLGERTKKYIDALKAGRDKVPTDPFGARLAVVDVVVTETSKPVYLVIAYGKSALFNLHVAEGARLSRIALIGPGTAAVANAEPETPVAALSGEATASCDVSPRRAPAPHWQLVQNVRQNPDFQADVNKLSGMHGAFSGWYRRNFGVPSEPDAIGAATTSHVLVGPLPETLEARAPYRSLKGAAVLMTSSDHAFAGALSDFKEEAARLIVEDATRMAGGSLDSLMPTQ
jgi:hypothetical protein